MDATAYATLQDAMRRMVVPLRREFGVALDVPRMERDIEYAEFAVALAMGSRTPALLERATLVAHYIRAARERAAQQRMARVAMAAMDRRQAAMAEL